MYFSAKPLPFLLKIVYNGYIHERYEVSLIKTAAIISEYNPFHSGHKFHIEETKKITGADTVAVIMSGNFVQRGNVALFNKETRAKMALLNGADLVIELPTRYALASAEFFAKGAVSILNALGSIDFLSFGAECEDISKLSALADSLSEESSDFSLALKKYSQKGLSFPSAQAKAAEDVFGKEAKELLSTPNNLLGIEYLKALSKSKSSITPVSILRTGAQHDSFLPSGNIASATYIRDLFLNGSSCDAANFLPENVLFDIEKEKAHSLKNIEKAILYSLINISQNELRQIADVSEGLENRIKAAAASASSLEEFFEKTKTKRYTLSRLRRIVLSAFLGIQKSEREMSPLYIKILGQTENGQKLIKASKKTSNLPILRDTSQVNKLNNPQIKAMWERERMFDSIYNLS